MINLYKFYRQHNNYLFVYTAHVSTTTDHPQVLQVSHIQLLNCSIHIPIYIHTLAVRKRLLSIHSIYEPT
jgi:hypothetical protein